jgi:hypothetical protein
MARKQPDNGQLQVIQSNMQSIDWRTQVLKHRIDQFALRPPPLDLILQRARRRGQNS